MIQLILVLIALSSCFQFSHWRLPARLLAAFSLAVITYLSYPWVIEQSRESLENWMDDSLKMQQLAVVLVIEAVIFILVDLALLKKQFGHPVKKALKVAAFYPGLLLLAVLLYAQMLCFYTFSEIDFDQLGVYFSLVVFFIFMGIPAGIGWTIPEGYLRMELRYILSFGQVLGGIVITIFCQKLPYPQQENSVEWQPFLIVVGTSFTTIFFGWLWSKWKQRTKLEWKF
ncbi:hypothetical protein [Flexithrix dorotheae]|uniref:hypothetical protein n=1 Tax=Flexithrix dorotheae TaxID=70993 RepID=UPI000399930E|nr:hypothetical protein [Flexithrix dorotheae]